MITKLMKFWLHGICFLMAVSANASSMIRLPRLWIQPGAITVSGVSSGAFMAVQLDVAASGMISGAGSVAGGLYGCAEGNPLTAIQLCMGNPSFINTAYFVNKVRQYALLGMIDSPENLKNHRIYIFQSKADETVRSEAATKLQEFYETFLPRGNLKLEWHNGAVHGFPTLYRENACNQAGPPWLINCEVDAAHHIFTHLYGELKPAQRARERNLFRFAQGPYASAAATLLDQGYLYIPQACQVGNAPCRLHVALHGCRQSPEFVGEEFVRRAGYNDWAEANRIVVLYPAVAKSVLNPKGCWDWWGYTGPNYATRSGPQVGALIRMIGAITSGHSTRRSLK